MKLLDRLDEKRLSERIGGGFGSLSPLRSPSSPSSYNLLKERLEMKKAGLSPKSKGPSESPKPSEEDQIVGNVVHQIFESADTNKDGSLTALELRAYVAREGIAESLALATGHRPPYRP